MTESALVQATDKAKAKTEPTLAELIELQRPAIQTQLAGAMDTGAFTRAALSVVKADDKLMQASAPTVLGAIMLAAQLRLEIGNALGHFYLTPRRRDDAWECLPIIGYKGYIELAFRNPRVDRVRSFVVRKGDHFDQGASSERGEFYDWKPLDGDQSREWVGVIAYGAIRGSGSTTFEYLTKKQVLSRRPSGWERGPWKNYEEVMARKTAIRALSPYLPMSIELATALAADEQRVEYYEGVRELQITRVDESDQ